jgi:hypothetical protein
VIVDSEGSVAAPGATSRLGLTLSLVSTVVAGAALLLLNELPREPFAGLASHGQPLARAIAFIAPPRLALALPGDAALELASLAPGAAPASPTLRAYRIRGTEDIVVVAAMPGTPEVPRPPDAPADALSVHGRYAEGTIVEASSVSVVRWTERGLTYEISSRTLLPRDLARLAELLR